MAEMHSGFMALRGACPMNLRTAWAGFRPDAAVLADLTRIEAIWAGALAGSGGPFLFGDYTLADAFYAPVAARIAGYGLPVSDAARAYVQAHLTHGPFRRWRAMGFAHGPEQGTYEMGLPRAEADPRTGRAIGPIAERHLPLFRQAGDPLRRHRRARIRVLQRVLPRQDRGRPRSVAGLHGDLRFVKGLAVRR